MRARNSEAGVAHLWLVDPWARILEVFKATDDGWRLVSARKDDAQVAEVPFDAVAFPVAALWARQRERRAGQRPSWSRRGQATSPKGDTCG